MKTQVPDGYRALKPGEIVQKGDLWEYVDTTHVDFHACSSFIGAMVPNEGGIPRDASYPILFIRPVPFKVGDRLTVKDQNVMVTNVNEEAVTLKFVKPITIGEYVVESGVGGIQVGCQFVPDETILAIAKMRKLV